MASYHGERLSPFLGQCVCFRYPAGFLDCFKELYCWRIRSRKLPHFLFRPRFCWGFLCAAALDAEARQNAIANKIAPFDANATEFRERIPTGGPRYLALSLKIGQKSYPIFSNMAT